MSPLDRFRALLALPHGRQPAAVRALLAEWPPEHDEAWNSRFGPESLFAAFMRCTVPSALRAANAAVVTERLRARPGSRVAEIGGGDGSLWREVPADLEFELIVVDPSEECAERVRAAVGPGTPVAAVVAPVERVELPPCDLVICSLTLHHVAGEDAAQRAAHGLAGPGKLEILRGFGDAVRPRDGRVVLGEADVYCDLALPPGDPLLVERLNDSYVRRFGRSILDDVETREVDASTRAAWRAILRDWALAQIGAADATIEARDVYELDVRTWLRLFDAAGLKVESRRCTDGYALFHQYVLR